MFKSFILGVYMYTFFVSVSHLSRAVQLNIVFIYPFWSSLTYNYMIEGMYLCHGNNCPQRLTQNWFRYELAKQGGIKVAFSTLFFSCWWCWWVIFWQSYMMQLFLFILFAHSSCGSLPGIGYFDFVYEASEKKA